MQFDEKYIRHAREELVYHPIYRIVPCNLVRRDISTRLSVRRICDEFSDKTCLKIQNQVKGD